jgi:hypothetical protein
MNENLVTEVQAGSDPREKARALALRHGEHAEDYVRTRIEASETAGESADAEQWRQVLRTLQEGVGQD